MSAFKRFLHIFRDQFRRAFRRNIKENRPLKPLRFISTRVNGESTYREVLLSAYEDPELGHLVLTDMSLMIVEKTRQELLCAEEAARQEWEKEKLKREEKFLADLRESFNKISVNSASVFEASGVDAGPCAKGEVL